MGDDRSLFTYSGPWPQKEHSPSYNPQHLGVASGRPHQGSNGGPANATSVIAFQEASSKSAADWSNANHYGEGVAQRATGRAGATCARPRARSVSRENSQL